jgi:hypothetical protein
VTALLAGQQPPLIKLNFIQWIIRLLPLIPLLQVVGVFTTLSMLQRWKKGSTLRPGGGQMWLQHIMLPLVPNLSLTALLVYLQSTGMIRFLNLFMPDLAWTARVCGGFAGLWALPRTGLILQALRKSRP